MPNPRSAPRDTSVRHIEADPAVAELISAFCGAIEGGRGGDLAELYTADAVADLTVPNWRFTASGPAEIGANYASWFAAPARFEELEVRPTPGGVTLVYTIAWTEGGIPHAAHHCHVLDFEGGRIGRDTVFCGGRWPATLLAQMEEAARAQ